MNKLAEPFVGREEEARVITLALMTKEHVVLIGEPGTAKSALARRAASLLNAKFFAYLLTKYTEPAEILGALDINSLKNGKYSRIMDGKLPTVQIAFLDEIFNASSSILNTILTILNERVIYDGYGNIIQTPLRTVIAATNIVPDDNELQAVYDRFLFRVFVKPVDETKMSELIKRAHEIEMGKKKIVEQLPILSIEDFDKAFELINEVNLDEVFRQLPRLIAKLRDMGIEISDRRKGKAVKVVAANALLNNRFIATPEDMYILKYVFASTSDEYEKINAMLTEELKTEESYLHELDEIYRNVKEVEKLVETADPSDPRLIEAIRSLKAGIERIDKLVQESKSPKVQMKGDEVKSYLEKIIDRIGKKMGII